MLEKDKMNIERILYSIEKIYEYPANIASADELYNDAKTFDAIVTQLISIGECANKISEEPKLTYKDIVWSGLLG